MTGKKKEKKPKPLIKPAHRALKVADRVIERVKRRTDALGETARELEEKRKKRAEKD